jgi:hypothetical protein
MQPKVVLSVLSVISVNLVGIPNVVLSGFLVKIFPKVMNFVQKFTINCAFGAKIESKTVKFIKKDFRAKIQK